MARTTEEIAWPTLGRTLQVRISDGEEEVDWDWRHAIVVGAELEICWLEVFLLPDDVPFDHRSGVFINNGHAYFRAKVANHGGAIGNWRWPPIVPPA